MRLYFFLFLLILMASPALAETTYFRGYNFESYLVSNSHPQVRFYEDSAHNGRAISVREGDEYSIVVRNPLPVRVAVAVNVDGLNTIDGDHSRLSRGSKWIVQPYGSITIRGWQTGDSSLRKFVFTKPQYSYVAWRERRDRRDYSHKLGEISVAYFWNSQELRNALYPPYDYGSEVYEGFGSSQSREKSLNAPGRYDDRAGTGMGRHEYNPVRAVNFHYDTGMYRERQALKINYSFGYSDYPDPEPRYWHPKRRYAPEMP